MADRLALSPELSLLAACCRWPGGAARTDAVRRAAAAPIDWREFQRLSTEHRVALQAAQALREAAVALPSGLSEAMMEGAVEAAQRALSMTRESLRLQQAFDAAGLPVTFIKGTSLSVLAYAAPAMREAKDIDLLVAPRSAAAARRLLEAQGYAVVDPRPDLDDDQFERLTGFAKDCALYNRSNRTLVELHWRLVQNDRLLAGVDRSDVRPVPVGGGTLTTLAPEPLFAFLCVHGAQHSWFRLRWAADIAAVLAPLDAVEIERLRDRAMVLGAGRSPDVALLLCHQLFGVILPEPMLRSLEADRTVRALVRNALWCLGHADGGKALSLHPLGIRSRLARYFTAPGLSFAWREFRLSLVSIDDRLRVVLPDRLAFLYPLLRVPLWVRRSTRRFFA